MKRKRDKTMISTCTLKLTLTEAAILDLLVHATKARSRSDCLRLTLMQCAKRNKVAQNLMDSAVNERALHRPRPRLREREMFAPRPL